MSSAKEGVTVGELMAMLAGHDPALRVRFYSSECGGNWPAGRARMGVYTGEQVHSVKTLDAALQPKPDESYFCIALLAHDPKPAPRWPGQPGTL